MRGDVTVKEGVGSLSVGACVVDSGEDRREVPRSYIRDWIYGLGPIEREESLKQRHDVGTAKSLQWLASAKVAHSQRAGRGVQYFKPRFTQTVKSRSYMRHVSESAESLIGEDTPPWNDGGAAVIAIAESEDGWIFGGGHELKTRDLKWSSTSTRASG